MTTTTISYKGYNLRVEYRYYPPLPATYNTDGVEELIDIHYIYLGDTDIYDLIDDHIDDIERLVAEKWEE